MTSKDNSKTFSLRLGNDIQKLNKNLASTIGINESAAFKRAVENYYLSYRFEQLLEEYKVLDENDAISPMNPHRDIEKHLPDFFNVLDEFIKQSERIVILREKALKIKNKLDLIDKMNEYFFKIKQAKSKELSLARNLIYTALDMTSLLEDNKYQEIERLLELVDKDNELKELNKTIESIGGKEAIFHAMEL